MEEFLSYWSDITFGIRSY